MNALDIAFAPELPTGLIITLIILSGAFVIWGLARGVRGSWLRALAWMAISLAMLNPSIVSEDREQLKNIVAIIVDNSGSQKLDGRDSQTEEIREKVVARINRLNNFEVRETKVADQISRTSDASTALFKAVNSLLQDVLPEQVAGTIIITDGQVHDIPKTAEGLAGKSPVHALITGHTKERDRRISIINAPRFGVVGEPVTLSFKVDQQGFASPRPVTVTILVDGEEFSREDVIPGETNEFDLDVPHGGKTIIELRVESDEKEISTVNNRVYSTLNGIRENLRVLLVSGEPHVGERTWRNLLTSDASVDLVHFTILRPPEKQDGTPINQLSLIAFPTRELFVEKIDEFDLIIFDRYSRRGVLPTLYFDNIARYVEDGGAVLVAAGPEFSVRGSIAQTPLQRVLPALPDGNVVENGFRPQISQLGKKHPVTRDLNPDKSKPPIWSPWYRLIGSESQGGDILMSGMDENPLLILNRAGEGRIALLLSDHVWLWARGFQGGGPHVQLLRRLAHWLMKEPELSEEMLSAQTELNKILVKRQSLKDDIGPMVLTTPSGQSIDLNAVQKTPGIFEVEVDTTELGLYQVENGDLRALTHVGPANPREYSHVLSTPDLLRPILSKTGGNTIRVSQNNIPRIIPVGNNSTSSGKGWIGIKNKNASLLKGINTLPLFSGLLGLALLLLAISVMWIREGR